MSSLLIAIPICYKDADLAIRNLDRLFEMDGQVRHHALVTYDTSLESSTVNEVIGKAKKCFERVHACRYNPLPPDLPWPRPQNNAWQSTARHIETVTGQQQGAFGSAKSWFWWEADTVLLKPRAFDILAEEHFKSGKRFFGHIVESSGHMNGVAIYPCDISNYCTKAMLVRMAPFDVVLSQELGIKDVGRANDWIGHAWKKRGGHTFEDVPVTLPESIVMFHGAFVPTQSVAQTITPISAPVVDEKYTGPSKFFHSGDLGDVIYALKAIKAAGGGDLILGPRIAAQHQKGRTPITATPFKFLAPLIEQQPYIKSLSYHALECPKTVCDLNGFREQFNKRRDTGDKQLSLARGHMLYLGLNAWNDDPWLELDTTKKRQIPKSQFARIIISRSPRYNDPQFPWKAIVEKFGPELGFVGLEEEHTRFCSAFGNVRRIVTHNSDTLAYYISQAQWFVGNQSFPCAVALGLGGNVFQETYSEGPDCLFMRQNFHNQFISGIEILA